MKKCMETNGKNRFASQGVSIAQMMYVSKYKSHKIALFNSMKKSNIAPISESFKFVAQGILEIYEEVYPGTWR